jgi:medium-chain acyl-[acyl-carrier-protein] hydrolase
MISHDKCDRTFSIASYETDFSAKFSLFALFNHFQDLAGIHADYLEVGYEQLRKQNLAWILSRIKLEINSLPLWGEIVKLATWPKGIDRLFAMRDFSLTRDNGEILVLATSAWLLVDIEKGRPQRFNNFPVDLTFPNAASAIDETPGKIEIPENAVKFCERAVQLSEIDVNHHVNNAHYAKWISDCFTEKQYFQRQIKSIQINYLDESKLGDTINLLKAPTDELLSEYFIQGINSRNGTPVFQASVSWI